MSQLFGIVFWTCLVLYALAVAEKFIKTGAAKGSS